MTEDSQKANRDAGRLAGQPAAAGVALMIWRLLYRQRAMIVRVTSFCCFLLAWEIYARQQSPIIMAPFTDVVVALIELLGTSDFRAAYWETIKPFGIGLTLAICTGVPLGLLIGSSRYFRSAFLPYVNFLNAVPMTAFIPLVVIAFGIGLQGRYMVVYLFAISELVLNSAAGVRYVDAQLIDMANSFGASRFRIFRSIILPGSMPGVMAGLRLGAGRSVVGMVAAELLLVSVGLGQVISKYRGLFQTENLYATVLIMAITGLLVLEVVRRIERRALHWQRGVAEANR